MLRTASITLSHSTTRLVSSGWSRPIFTIRGVSSTHTFTTSTLKPPRILTTASSLVLKAALRMVKSGFAFWNGPRTCGMIPSS